MNTFNREKIISEELEHIMHWIDMTNDKEKIKNYIKKCLSIVYTNGMSHVMHNQARNIR